MECRSAPAAVLLPRPIAFLNRPNAFAVQPAVPDFVPSNLPAGRSPELTPYLLSQIEGRSPECLESGSPQP